VTVDSVREARLSPDKPVLRVGDTLKCSASGNPTPQLTFSPPSEAKTSGQRHGIVWMETVVPSKWKGQQQTVNCTAVNILDGLTHTMITSVTFSVTGQHTSY